MTRRQHQQHALETVAHQRQRRAYVDCTNLHSGHRPRVRDDSSHVIHDIHDGQDGETTHTTQKKKQRDRFVLPLVVYAASTSTSNNNNNSKKRSCALDDPSQRERDVDSGAPHGHHVEWHAKSFKDEPWYKSPVGFGSKASVVLLALKQRDVAGSGFLPCRDVVKALQAPDFGLTEFQVRSLISRFDSTLHDDPVVHYATFTCAIQFPQTQLQGTAAVDCNDGERNANDMLFCHQTYVEKIREHANRLVQKLPHDSHGHESLSTSTSPWKEDDQCGSGMLTDSNVSFSALPMIHNAPSSLPSPTELQVTSPDKREDVDRLSFEFDKQRRANRMAAKASTLLAHINRIEAVAKHEQMLQEQHDALRLAAKALHRHDHYARLLETETHDVRMLEKQCKGLVRSELTRMNRNVSRDSMFCVEPT
ncbi:hypothetical protein FI667_g10031, partial [Globisporangium splendens]